MRDAIANATRYQIGLLPLWLRLGFHDCVGGCNGCINFNNPDNNGLKPAVDTLNALYVKNNFQSTGASRADFWAMAAAVGLGMAVRSSNGQRNNGLGCTPQSCPGPCPIPCMTLQWGRVDAATCTDEPPLPSPTMTSTGLFSYFQQQFGFTRAQVVTIMGAHSLGGAKAENSGYKGKWTGPDNAGFSELFYTNMISKDIKWTNVNVSPPNGTVKWQYDGVYATSGGDAGFMLNTDFEMFYELSLDSNAQTTCTLAPTCGLSSPNTCGSSCPVSSTFNQALAYSKDCNLFMTDFLVVLNKMLTNKNTNLVSSSSSCCPL